MHMSMLASHSSQHISFSYHPQTSCCPLLLKAMSKSQTGYCVRAASSLLAELAHSDGVELSLTNNQFRRGAKLRLCIGQGPCNCIAAICAAVPYPLCCAKLYCGHCSWYCIISLSLVTCIIQMVTACKPVQLATSSRMRGNITTLSLRAAVTINVVSQSRLNLCMRCFAADSRHAYKTPSNGTAHCFVLYSLAFTFASIDAAAMTVDLVSPLTTVWHSSC